jgi:hypothetical protein
VAGVDAREQDMAVEQQVRRMRGGEIGVRGGPLDAVVETDGDSARCTEPSLDTEQVIEVGRLAIADAQLHDGHVEPALDHHLVRQPPAAHVLEPASLEIHHVIGVVHDAHHVGVGDAHPLQCFRAAVSRDGALDALTPYRHQRAPGLRMGPTDGNGARDINGHGIPESRRRREERRGELTM